MIRKTFIKFSGSLPALTIVPSKATESKRLYTYWVDGSYFLEEMNGEYEHQDIVLEGQVEASNKDEAYSKAEIIQCVYQASIQQEGAVNIEMYLPEIFSENEFNPYKATYIESKRLQSLTPFSQLC